AALYLGLLGLELGVTPEEVQAKYRAMVRMWHPDRFTADPASSAEASERLRKLNEAMSWLRLNEHVWAGWVPDASGAAKDTTPHPPSSPGQSGQSRTEGPTSEGPDS